MTNKLITELQEAMAWQLRVAMDSIAAQGRVGRAVEALKIALSSHYCIDCNDAHDPSKCGVLKSEDIRVCNICKTPAEYGKTDYGLGWRIICGCPDGFPQKAREKL